MGKHRSKKDHRGPRRSKGRGDRFTNQNIVYGRNPVLEVLLADRRRVHNIWLSPEAKSFLENDSRFADLPAGIWNRVEIKDGEFLERKSGGGVHQGAVILVDDFPFVPLLDLLEIEEEEVTLVILDSVQDPQNLGAISRSVMAFGADGLILPKDRSAPINAAAFKASAGAIEHLPISVVTNLATTLNKLKDAGFWSYGAHLTDASESLPDLDLPAKRVFVFGAEGKGLRPLVAKNCDVLYKIPMPGKFESLNVAQAVTATLYENARTQKPS